MLNFSLSVTVDVLFFVELASTGSMGGTLEEAQE